MTLKILSDASRDLREGYRFYEAQSEGLGSYFAEALFAEIDSLRHSAGIHPIYFDRYHRMLSRRFPFAVFYRLDKEVVVVCAIVDCRRSPAWVRNRLN